MMTILLESIAAPWRLFGDRAVARRLTG